MMQSSFCNDIPSIISTIVLFCFLFSPVFSLEVFNDFLQEIETSLPGNKMKLINAHLKKINKPFVKSIKSPDGDTIDRVLIYLQSAFDHPELKGTLPLARTVIVMNTLEDYALVIYNNNNNTQSRRSKYAIGYVTQGEFYGAKAHLNVWAPNVTRNDFSSSSIWIISGDQKLASAVSVGWEVNLNMYKNNDSRLYISWTHQAASCHNLQCPGFVQINQKFCLGAAINPISTYNGQQHLAICMIWKDPRSGDWWLKVGSELIGYWPKNLFPDLSERHGAKTIEYGGEVYSDNSGLKTSWKYSPKKPVIYHRGQEMDFRSFMVQGVDGEFNFLHEGGLDENRSSTKFVNNDAPVIKAEPIFAVHPSNIAENIMNSRNTSSEEGGLSPIGHDAPSYLEVGKRSMVAGKRKVVVGSHGEDPHRKARKVLAQASKVAGEASTPLDVDSDPDIHGKPDPSILCEFPSAKELKDATNCHWVIAHVTPPSWKQYLREISIEQLSRESCDIIREREIKKDKAYAELEKKCNEALEDLDKNPLVFDMCAEIETLHSRVKGLHRKRLRASEIQLLQGDSLRQDRAAVVARVILDTVMKLICSDEIGVLIARLVKASIIHGRCASFKEVDELKKPFVLEEMLGYRPLSKEEYD
ncbi:reverse transcriptase domain-containing protein [Tanacetum coccineum]